MANKQLYRTMTLESTRTDEKARTIEASLSSETPVERWDGQEILSHDEGAIDLSRADSMPLCWSHDTNVVIGVVENIRLAGQKLRGVLRFGNSSRAQEVWQDVREGILKNLSVGYRVDETEKTNVGYKVSRWTLLEVSLVGIPADATVGIGRSFKKTNSRSTSMENKDQVEIQAKESARIFEIKEITAMAAKHPQLRQLADEAINSGLSLERFRVAAWEKITNATPLPSSLGELDHGNVGLNRRELEGYSLMKVLKAQMTNDWSEAGLEREASRAVAKQIGRSPQGIFIPSEVLSMKTRGLTAGTGSSGGYTVATELRPESFIEVLRARTQVIGLGATVMSGLKGNIEIPRQTGVATGYWVAEGGNITVSEQTFDQLTLTPKTVGARTQFTRRLMLQATPDVEQLVRNDLAGVLAGAIDSAAILGGGSNEPTGILQTSGIGDVAGGTNGAAPTWAHIAELMADVEVGNADVGQLAFLTNALVKKKLLTTEKASNTAQFVWETGADGEGRLAGRRALVSNNVPSNLDKGSSTGICSAIIFGNWRDLVIAQWSGLDILVDPHTLSASGGIIITAFMDLDIGVRHVASFTAMQDALTT